MNHPIPKLLVLALALSCCFGCKKEKEQTEPAFFDVLLGVEQPNASKTGISVEVHCDMAWEASLESSTFGTITRIERTPDGGSFTLSLGFNTGSARSNVLIVRSGTAEVRKKFTQSGIDQLFEPGSLLLRGTVPGQIVFTPGLDWTVSCSSEWLAPPSPASGKAGSACTVKIAAKEDFLGSGSRESSLTFVFDGKYEVSIPVVQESRDPRLDVSTYGFYALSDGSDYALQPNSSQMGVSQNIGAAFYQVRLQYPGDKTVCSLDQVPCGMEDGASASLELLVSREGKTLVKEQLSCVQIGSDATHRWLLDTGGHACFIIPMEQQE